MEKSELFDINDLHRGLDKNTVSFKNFCFKLSQVLRCLIALARQLAKRKDFKGPLPSTIRTGATAFEVATTTVIEEEEEISLTEEEIEEPTEFGGPPRKRVPFFQRLAISFRGGIAFASYLVMLFLIAGGNYGDYFLNATLENTAIFAHKCFSNVTSLSSSAKTSVFVPRDSTCFEDTTKLMFWIAHSAALFCFGVGGIVFNFLGPKVSGCVGLFGKIAGGVILAIASQELSAYNPESNANYSGLFYIGYIVFTAASKSENFFLVILLRSICFCVSSANSRRSL